MDRGLNNKCFPFQVIIGYIDDKLINCQKMVYEYALMFVFYLFIFYGRKDLSLSSFLSKLSLHR